MFNVLDYENYIDVIKYYIEISSFYKLMVQEAEKENEFLNPYVPTINHLLKMADDEQCRIDRYKCSKGDILDTKRNIAEWEAESKKLRRYNQYLKKIALEDYKEERAEFEQLFCYMKSEYESVGEVVKYVTKHVKIFGNHPASFQMIFEQYKKEELEKRNNKAMALEQK